MKMRDVIVAVPEESVADFYLLVGRWLKDLGAGDAASGEAASAQDAGPAADAGPAQGPEAEPAEAAPPAKPRGRRASRYDAIAGLLEERDEDTVELSFDEVEAAIEAPLPDSARRHRAWWSNTEATSQARAWLGAGYGVQGVDLEEGRITLERR